MPKRILFVRYAQFYRENLILYFRSRGSHAVGTQYTVRRTRFTVYTMSMMLDFGNARHLSSPLRIRDCVESNGGGGDVWRAGVHLTDK